MLRPFPILLTLLMIGSPANAQVNLRWDWEKNDTFYVKTIIDSEQQLTILNAEESTGRHRRMSLWFRQTIVMKYTTEGKQKDGTLKIVQELMTAVVQSKQGSMAVDNDLNGAKLTYHVDAQNKVTKVEGYEKLISRISPGNEKNPKVQWTMKVLSKDSLAQSLTQLLELLPNKSVKKGDKWTTSFKQDMGSLGRIEVTHNYEMRGPTFWFFADQGERINVTSKMGKHEAAPEGDARFRITESKLEGGGSGQVYFDPKNSRVHSASRELTLKGSMTLKNSIHKRDVELLQTQKTRLFITETSPLATLGRPKPEQ